MAPHVDAVTDETAAGGKKSLKITDAPDLKQAFNPHFYYQPHHRDGITTGSFDLLCTTFLKTQDDLSSFVREYLGTIPGVVSHEVMVLMKVTKDNLGADWGFRTQSSMPSA